MQFVNRKNKGQYKYLRNQLIFEIIMTILLFAMAFGIFVIGYKTLGTRKNLWSVLAVLAMLPSSKSLVGVIMLARFRSLTPDKYDFYRKAIGNVPALFENVITTSKTSYYIPVICCRENTLIGFCDRKASEVNEVNEHLATVLKNAGHKSVTVKIFDKEEAFLSRVSQMDENLDDTKDQSVNAIFTTIKAVSL